MFSRDTLHLWILAGALGLIGVGFFTVRGLTIPPSFGQFGHFRGAALETAANKERHLTTRGDCTACHETLKHPMGKSHELVHCIECHGEGKEHMTACKTAKLTAKPGEKLTCDKSNLMPTDIKSICLHCHQQMVGRAKKHPQIVFEEHMKDNEPKDPKSKMVCMECHVPHDPDPSNEPGADKDEDAAKPADAATPTAAPAAATKEGGEE